MLVENLAVPDDPRVWPEACALRDAGFSVSIISPKGIKEHQESHSRIDGINIYRYRFPSGESPLSYFAEYATALIMTFLISIRVWLLHGFDVIHVANPPDVFFPIALFYRVFGKKFVFDQHDLTPELFYLLFAKRISGRVGRILRQVLFFCERSTYRAAHLVIVANESFQKRAIERWGCAELKIAIVRNGPDLQRFGCSTHDPYQREAECYTLIFIGMMGIQDGVQYALRAMEVLVHRRGRQDIALVLVGDGPYAPTLRSLALELDLNEHVKFTGYQSPDEVIQHLSRADVGLVPDPLNGLNEFCTMIKAMEYMAAGLPMVAFDLQETRYSAQGAALYATPNDVEEFATRIEDVLADDSLRHKMGALGRQRVEAELSWDYSKEQLLSAYARLLGMPTSVLASRQEA
jgi:asparagine synthase (glutamine-hydrolysing)